MLLTIQDKGTLIREKMTGEIVFSEQTVLSNALSTAAKVHEIRKSIKRMRALLRILKTSVEPGKYYLSDGVLSRAGYYLSDMRDALVCKETFSDLMTTHAGFPASERIFSFLEQRYEQLHENEDKLRDSLVYLRQFSVILNELDFAEMSYPDMINRLENLYIKMFESYEAARYTLEAEVIHTWRKQAKYFYLLLKQTKEYIGNIQDSVFQDLDELTHILGVEHDLYMLENLLNNELNLDTPDKGQLHLMISKSRNKASNRAFHIAQSLFSYFGMADLRMAYIM
ncbi:MAG: CHAD domain-containing protein [Bacteroidales bacterium]|nr:CHAD domain-containing protein [Bacteroidales bacterium]